MRTLLSLRMACEHVRAGFGRMALSVVAIALGVALVVAIRLMNTAVLASFLNTIDATAGRAALTVTAGEGLSLPEAVRDTVAGVPGVQLAVPLVRAVAFPDDGTGEVLTVLGVDLANEAEVRAYHSVQDDPTEVIDDLLVFLAQPNSIVLGADFARRRGLGRGSIVRLVTPTGVRSFVVRGLMEPQGLAKTLGGRLVVMDLFAAERAFASDGMINQIDILLATGADLEAVKAAVTRVLPAGLHVNEPALRKDVLRRTVGGFQGMLAAFSLLAVVAGFVVCYSRLRAIFEARTWEVGLLRAVGLRRGAIVVELVKESLLLGMAGTALGIPAGVLIAKYGLPAIAKATAVNFNLPVASAAPLEIPHVLALGVATGLLSAVFAAVVPALRLARKQPIAALTLRGRDSSIAAPIVSIAASSGLVAIAVALVIVQR